MMIWTNKKEDQLRALWADGISASKCAIALGNGLTRNAVIGKVYRMQLPARKTVTPKPRKREWSDKSRAAMSLKMTVRNLSRKRPVETEEVISDRVVLIAPEAFKPAEVAPVDAWAALPGTAPIELLALSQDTCRWPIGDELPFTFCGCSVATGSVYCAEHRRRGTGIGTAEERRAKRAAVTISRLEVKNGFRQQQAGQSL